MKSGCRFMGSAGGALVGRGGEKNCSLFLLRLRSKPSAQQSVWRKWRSLVRSWASGELMKMSSMNAWGVE